MSWMFQQNNNDAPIRLKKLLASKQALQVPGVFNPLVAMLAREKGFKALYVSGAAFSASLGLPDLGYFTVTQLADYIQQVYRTCDLPIIVDVDTGFGEVLHIPQTVHIIESAGGAAIQIEDQELPKKCGHLEGKKLVSTADMCRKIEAAVKVRKELLIVARTDAHSLFGIEEALNRAQAYVEAGADIIFPEALKTEEEFCTFSSQINVPLLANMTEFGKTPYYTSKQFHDWGYQITIYPVSTLRSAMKAVDTLFDALLQHGTQENLVDNMQTRKELYDLLDYNAYGIFDTAVADSAKYIT